MAAEVSYAKNNYNYGKKKLTQDTNNVIVKGHTRSFINCKGRAKKNHCHNSNMYCYLKCVFFFGLI